MPARSITRAVSVVDRLLVLAPCAHGGRHGLAPPPGAVRDLGLELDDAMRLLGGPPMAAARWLRGGAMGALVWRRRSWCVLSARRGRARYGGAGTNGASSQPVPTSTIRSPVPNRSSILDRSTRRPGVPTPSETARPISMALISVAQAAALLGVHPNTLRAWTDAGRLTAYRINARGDRRYRRVTWSGCLPKAATRPTPSATTTAAPGGGRTKLPVHAAGAGQRASATPTAICRTAIEVLRTTLGVARAAIYLVPGRVGMRPGPGDACRLPQPAADRAGCVVHRHRHGERPPRRHARPTLAARRRRCGSVS